MITQATWDQLKASVEQVQTTDGRPDFDFSPCPAGTQIMRDGPSRIRRPMMSRKVVEKCHSACPLCEQLATKGRGLSLPDLSRLWESLKDDYLAKRANP